MLEIDLDRIVPDCDDSCALVICEKTGIFYTAQCGGLLCSHPAAEGFYLPIWDIAPEINDCDMGCSSISKAIPQYDRPDLRDNLAKAIDIALESNLATYSFVLKFDYSRIDELQEGWWPLIITGTLHGVELNHQCYLHRENCD